MTENTNGIGARTEGMIMAALLRAGKTVLTPFGVQSYDLVFEDEAGFHRVQCKTGRLKDGAIVFETCSRHSRTLQRTSYRGRADYFGVYAPGWGECYLVPVDRVGDRQATLRVESSRNNQVRGTLPAQEFLVRLAHR